MTTPGKIALDPKIIGKSECDKGFSCLSEAPLYCSVLSTLGYNLLMLECRLNLDCRHNRIYGALHTCTCPVRHAIFTKYGK